MENPVSAVAGAVSAVATVVDHAEARQDARDDRLEEAAKALGAPLPEPAPEIVAAPTPAPTGLAHYFPRPGDGSFLPVGVPAVILTEHGDGTADLVLLITPEIEEGFAVAYIVRRVPYSTSNQPRSWHWPPLT